MGLKKKIFALFMLMLMGFPQVHSQESLIMVEGRVSSEPVEYRYDLVDYYVFNLTVESSNSSLYMLGDSLMVLLPISFGKPDYFQLLQLVGYIDENATNEVPDGAFVAVELLGSEQPTWIDAFKGIVSAISSVMANIVNAIVQAIYIGTGYMVPAPIVTLILAALFLFMIIRYHKILGLFVVLVLAFLVFSGFMHLLSFALT